MVNRSKMVYHKGTATGIGNGEDDITHEYVGQRSSHNDYIDGITLDLWTTLMAVEYRNGSA